MVRDLQGNGVLIPLDKYYVVFPEDPSYSQGSFITSTISRLRLEKSASCGVGQQEDRVTGKEGTVFSVSILRCCFKRVLQSLSVCSRLRELVGTS